MHTTIYLHPHQTLVARWDTDGEAPVIVSYNELSPSDDVRHVLHEGDAVTVALHAGALRWHHFPVDEDEDSALRSAFEIATCLPDVDPISDRIVTINEPTPGKGRTWCALTAISRRTVDDVAMLVSPEAMIVPDIVCDLFMARSCIAPQPHRWALVGLRGDRWLCAIVDTDHTIAHVVAFPTDASQSYTENALEAFFGVSSASPLPVKHLLMFGDGLTKKSYDELAVRLSDRSVVIGRLQPLRRVGASVDDPTKRSLLAIAHIIGPLVAPLLPAFIGSDVRANP